MSGPRVPLNQLIVLCHTVRHGTDVGIPTVRVWSQLASQNPSPLKGVADRVALKLQKGNSLKSALEVESGLPNLFISLASVGEQTGSLPEILRLLQEYYEGQRKRWRQFRAQITPVAIQFVLAVFIVAFVIWILGVLGSRPGSPGGLLGLSGFGGALTFVGLVFGGLALLYFAVRQVGLFLSQKTGFASFCLRLPIIGPCLLALALTRFTFALQLTLDSGMSIRKAVRLSLQATDNIAFQTYSKRVAESLKSGEDLTQSLGLVREFPSEFLNIVAVGEQSGRVPEIMAKQAAYYQEESERKLKAVAQLCAGLVWILYAAFMIAMIFRIANVYFSALGL
ncbi:MAG: type II secretion system F family protein [Gemmataceae bacterium]